MIENLASWNWNAIAAAGSVLAGAAALIAAVIAWREVVRRQRPYVFVESLNAKISGSGIPKQKSDRIRPADAANAPDLVMENWIYLKNAGPVPAKLKPLEVTYLLDGEPIDTGETTTKIAALYPHQQAHNIAVLKSGLADVFKQKKTLLLKIRIDYDALGAKEVKRYYSDITLRYVVNPDNLWACSWDYEEASGN